MIEIKSGHHNTTSDLLSELEDPHIQQAMVELIRKLPELQSTLHSIEDIVLFGKTVIQDEQTTSVFEERLSTYNINADTIYSLFMLIEKLPTLVKVIQQFEGISAFILSIMQDKESSAYLLNNLKEYTDPFLQDGKNWLTFIKEVRDRAECQPQSITVFSIMRWLKDPTIQKTLCYVQAALNIVAEKKTR